MSVKLKLILWGGYDIETLSLTDSYHPIGVLIRH